MVDITGMYLIGLMCTHIYYIVTLACSADFSLESLSLSSPFADSTSRFISSEDL